jgi:Ca2+-binding RTX toxin-like protein
MTIPVEPNLTLALNSRGVITTTLANSTAFFKITLPQTGTLHLSTYQSGSPFFDTGLSLYNSAKGFLTANDDSGGSVYSAIDVTLPAGDYYVAAGFWDNTSSTAVGEFGFQSSFTTASNPSPVILDVGTISFGFPPPPASYTQAQLDAAVSVATAGLHNQAYTDSAVAAAHSFDASVLAAALIDARVGYFSQFQLDSAVSAATVGLHNQAYTDSVVSAAVSGLFTQTQLDSAVSLALSAVPSVPVSDNSSILANLADVDISSASHSVTFSKLKSDYTAFDTDKKVVGNALANKIVTSSNSTNVSAGDGNDTVNGGAGNDTIDGGKGDDSIDGGAGNDSLNGGDGNDTINAGSGNNTVSGGKGSDSIVSGNGNDKIDAGDDNDTIISGDGNDSISGGAGNDSLTVGVGADTIDGGKGDDVIVSNGANSKLSGGDDNDSISLVAIDAVVVSSVDTLDGGAGNDSLTVGGFSGKHKLTGGAGNDTLTHSDLNGSATLDGGAGSDILRSHNSLDVLTGGADADFFNIAGANGSIKITDFKSTVDKLVFTDSVTPIALDASHFVTSITNSFVFTAADSYGFNSKTGALFHDVDGAGGVDAVQVALLGKVPLIASDILI